MILLFFCPFLTMCPLGLVLLPAPSLWQIHVTDSFPKCFANIGTIHFVLFLWMMLLAGEVKAVVGLGMSMSFSGKNSEKMAKIVAFVWYVSLLGWGVVFHLCYAVRLKSGDFGYSMVLFWICITCESCITGTQHIRLWVVKKTTDLLAGN